VKTGICIAALFLATACGGGGGSTSNLSTSSFVVGPPAVPQIAESVTASANIRAGLNGVRAAEGNGARPLTYDSRLGVAARRHANDMAANRFFDHEGSDGSSGGDRISDAGYNWIAWGENIAVGQQNESIVLQDWVDSPGHQRNNVNVRFENFALARADSPQGRYWVLVFGAE